MYKVTIESDGVSKKIITASDIAITYIPAGKKRAQVKVYSEEPALLTLFDAMTDKFLKIFAKKNGTTEKR